MKQAMIGLGRVGGNMARRLLTAGHRVVGYNRSEAINLDVPAPVITLSLFRRFESRQDESYAAKLQAAMRYQFGGHAIKRDV